MLSQFKPLPYRLVAHFFSIEAEKKVARAHLDLFLYRKGADFLDSYELDFDLYQHFLYYFRQGYKVALQEISETEYTECLENKEKGNGDRTQRAKAGCTNSKHMRIPKERYCLAHAKPKHRLIYWSYEGLIQGKRGWIEHCGRGLFYSLAPQKPESPKENKNRESEKTTKKRLKLLPIKSKGVL